MSSSDHVVVFEEFPYSVCHFVSHSIKVYIQVQSVTQTFVHVRWLSISYYCSIEYCIYIDWYRG